MRIDITNLLFSDDELFTTKIILVVLNNKIFVKGMIQRL